MSFNRSTIARKVEQNRNILKRPKLAMTPKVFDDPGEELTFDSMPSGEFGALYNEGVELSHNLAEDHPEKERTCCVTSIMWLQSPTSHLHRA
eukprot:3431449-Amphidinium_carterae.2